MDDILKFYDKILNTSMVFNILLFYQKIRWRHCYLVIEEILEDLEK